MGALESNNLELISTNSMDCSNLKDLMGKTINLKNTEKPFPWRTLFGRILLLLLGLSQAFVIYTGKETRSVMNTRESRYKFGLVDSELNFLTKVCFVLMCFLAFLVLLGKGIGDYWMQDYFRFVLLLSSIIPISLRVNLDAAKILFAYNINNDQEIEGTVTRNSTIPEELGRV